MSHSALVKSAANPLTEPLAPVPVAPPEQLSHSPGQIALRRVHLNDMSMLKMKARRREVDLRKVLDDSPREEKPLSPSPPKEGKVTSPSGSPVASPSGSPIMSPRSPKSPPSPLLSPGSPTSASSPSRSRRDSSGSYKAKGNASVGGVSAQMAAVQSPLLKHESPLLKHEVPLRARAATADGSGDRRMVTLADVQFPSTGTVNEALLVSEQPNNHPAARRQSTGSGVRLFGKDGKFKTAFTGSGLVSMGSSESEDYEMGDGGFAAHMLNFRLPIFSPTEGFFVETHANDERAAWERLPKPATMKIPSPLVRVWGNHFGDHAAEPRLWIWERQLVVIAAAPESDRMVRVVIVTPTGSQCVLVELPNIEVMSQAELFRQLMQRTNPLIPPEECVRVRGVTKRKAWMEFLTMFEKRVIPLSLDVGVLRVTSGAKQMDSSAGMDTGRSFLKRSSRAACPFELFMNTLCGREVSVEKGSEVSYTWQDRRIRLHFLGSLKSASLASFKILLAFVEDEQPMPALVDPYVVIGVRESATPKQYYVACCQRREVPPFGPPFWVESIKEKWVSPVISCKLWAALAAVRGSVDFQKICGEREALLRSNMEKDE